MNVRDAYGTWSSTYDSDRNLTRDLDATATRSLLDQRRFHRILELGCGTGKNTEFFARICTELLALDFTPEMLERARAKVPAPHVSFVRADLTAPWPCPDRSIDLISGNLVLEHIEDLFFIFAEAARTLAHSGTLLISELHPYRQYGGTRASFTRGETSVDITAHVHHVSEFLAAAQRNGLALKVLKEWWHEDDAGKPPRLITMMFQKR